MLFLFIIFVKFERKFYIIYFFLWYIHTLDLGTKHYNLKGFKGIAYYIVANTVIKKSYKSLGFKKYLGNLCFLPDTKLRNYLKSQAIFFDLKSL